MSEQLKFHSDRKLFLFDGSALAYRAHFALAKASLSNRMGEPTGAIFGFLNILLRILERYHPDQLAVVFDAPGETARHRKFPDYKATRDKMPDELAIQLPKLKELLRSMGIPVVEREGIEADDIIGTLAKRASDRGLEVWIVSGDKDFVQLVNSRTFLLIPGIGKKRGDNLLDRNAVLEKYGVSPEQFVDYLALVGDSSDNIPGVSGIGEKTAQKLLQEFGSLDSIYQNLSKIKPAQKKKLEQGRESALLSKELVQIDTDIPLEIEIGELKISKTDRKKLYQILDELEFKQLTSRIEKLLSLYGVEDIEKNTLFNIQTDVTIELIVLESVKEEPSLNAIFRGDRLSLYISPGTVEPEGLFLSDGALAVYFPLDRLKRGDFQRLQNFLSVREVQLIGHDLKDSIVKLDKYGLHLKSENIYLDTMIAAHILDPNRDTENLFHLFERFLPYNIDSMRENIKVVFDKNYSFSFYSDRGLEGGAVVVYSLFQLGEKLEERLKGEGRFSLYSEFERPLISILAEMEIWGIAVDTSMLQQFKLELERELREIEEEIALLSGEPDLNVQSPLQIGNLLFEKLKLHEAYNIKIKKTPKTEAWATDSDTLSKLAPYHPLPKLILEHRDRKKRLSTYIEPLLKFARLDSSGVPKIHTKFKQVGTRTGRLSSVSPNLQNIPIRTPEGREIRKAFIPTYSDWILISADYSQIELRILAHFSEDPTLLKAFKERVDIHRLTASLIFSVPPEEITYEQRSFAKSINFGIIYGMGVPRLARELNISEEEATSFIKAYFRSYPKVKEFVDRTIQKARENRYVETLFRRRRYIPEINSKDKKLRAHAEHIAINTPIQGTAADIMKKAMIAVHNKIKEKNLSAKLLLQIHDELLLEAPAEEWELLNQILTIEMSSVVSLKVPLSVQINSGKNWGEIKD